jgi:hypothetical protein
MSFLEKKIADNKAFFDDRPLPEGHFGRFLEKFNRQDTNKPKKSSRSWYLKIAAAIALLLTGSFILNKIPVNSIMDSFFDGYYVIKLSPELEDIFNYYDQVTQSKMEEIPQLTLNDEESQKVKEFARQQLEKINANIAALEKEYAKYPNNKALEEALISSKNQKSQIVESITNMLNNSDLKTIMPETFNN